MRARASLAFARTGFHFNSDHRLIVERVGSGSMVGDGLENFVNHAIGRLGCTSGDNGFDTFLPEGMAVPVARVENTVTVENKQIAGLGLETDFVVIGFVK